MMENPEKRKKTKKSKHRKKEAKHKRRRSSSESSSENEWVEKCSLEQQDSPPLVERKQHEDWLDLSNISTFSTDGRKKERELEKNKKRLDQQYDPKKYHLELNPYWKNDGTGLPSFKKPSEDINDDDDDVEKYQNIKQKSSNWKISKELIDIPVNQNTKEISKIETPNAIAAKLVKAEIMGDTKLVEELKLKLEQVKQSKLEETQSTSDVILTLTDSKGYSQPLKINEERRESKKQKKKRNENVKMYDFDDKYSLKEMFESEKQSTSHSLSKEFIKMAGKVRDNDLSDLFLEESDPGNSSGDVNSAINQHRKVSKSLDSCPRCLQSDAIMKDLIITFNDNCYLSLPSVEPLVEGHCLISPTRHVSCSVQLDENEWEELKNFKRNLTNFFKIKNQTVVFFEIAKSFHKYPHMVLECIPMPKSEGDLAPIYFKKAIEESETEWSHNKKLVIVKDNDVRKSVPKGLPYFYVSFGMDEGFAHVIEDQSIFPSNFAQEIIGGMLDIHHSKWRRPRNEEYEKRKKRVLEFSNFWKSMNEKV